MAANSVAATSNYLVPIDGTTHVVFYSFSLTSTPQTLSWGAFSTDNFPFVAQGAYVDNTGGGGPLTINIQGINFSCVVQAGTSAWVSFPATDDAMMDLTGNGAAKIHFVNYPVIPAVVGPSAVYAGQRNSIGRQTLTVTNAAVVTPTVPYGAGAAMIQADGASISITLDSTTPTNTIGLRLDDGTVFPIPTNPGGLKMIARATTTNVQIEYFDRM